MRLGRRIYVKDPLICRGYDFMQRIVCPDAESWTMVERLSSVDVEKLGKVVEFGESVHFRRIGEINALRRGDQKIVARCLRGTSREIWCCDSSRQIV